MNKTLEPAKYLDMSERYYAEVQKVSDFTTESEYELSLKKLLISVTQHHLFMSVPELRIAYRSVIADSLSSNKNLTEITRGSIFLSKGEIFYRPVQKVSPNPPTFTRYGAELTKESLAEVLIPPADHEYPLLPLSGSSSVRLEPHNLTLSTLIPSEEIRIEITELSRELPLSKWLRTRLESLEEDYQKSVNRLVHRNLRLVLSIVKNELGHVNDLDAIQEGNLGLLKGISRYQPLSGYKLTTYCTWWIMKYVKQSRYASRLIRMPFNLRESYARVQRYLQENPEVSESSNKYELISQATGIALEKVKNAMSASGTVLYAEDVENYDLPQENEYFESGPDEIIASVVDRLSPEDKVIFWDYLTLSPQDKKRTKGSGDVSKLKSSLLEFGEWVE